MTEPVVPATPASNLIGFLCDTPMVGSGYFGMLQIGLMAGCHKWETALVIKSFDLTDPWLGDRVRSLLERTPLRGLILPEPICEIPAVLDAVADAGLPVVRIAPHTDTGKTLDICLDNRAAAYDMTRHLIELGHKAITFVKGPPDHGDAIARLEGFRAAMADAGLPVDEAALQTGGFDYAQGLGAAEHLLAQTPLPTAVFACNDEVAAAVLSTAHRLGLEIPDDFSLAGFDDSPLARSVFPQITTCRQKMELTGYMAVDFVIDPPTSAEARKRPMQHELVIRQSTGKPRC
jgi:LacI family transcriptional regulator